MQKRFWENSRLTPDMLDAIKEDNLHMLLQIIREKILDKSAPIELYSVKTELLWGVSDGFGK